MAEPAVPLARMAHLTLVAFECALSAGDGNGGAAPTAEVRYTLGRLALAAPGTAARCPHVRHALPPDALAFVLASAAPATPPAPPATCAADSGTARVGARAAARRLGVSAQAVRAAAKRGTLPGARDKVTGEWRFTRAAVDDYRRTRAGRHRET
jgi:hypothetical protein